MIIGIGVDLVEVGRVKTLLKNPNISRIFTSQEIKYCQSRKNVAESFAVRFAAKEAFLKAIGTGWGTAQSPKLNEISVQIHSLYLNGKAKSICRKLKVIRTHLSLTHTKGYAMAVVILEGC